jgi:hypothetical protein
LFACRVWMQSNRRWLGSSALRPAIIRKFRIAGVVRRRGESAAHPSYGGAHLSTRHFTDQGLFPVEFPLMARSVSRKVRGVEHAGQPSPSRRCAFIAIREKSDCPATVRVSSSLNRGRNAPVRTPARVDWMNASTSQRRTKPAARWSCAARSCPTAQRLIWWPDFPR